MTSNSVNINQDGLQVFNATTGVFTGVDLTTKGDILSKTTTIYTRRAVGTDGHALVCDSAQTTGLNYQLKENGSAIVFLQSQTASNSATIDFTAFNDATYEYYFFTYTNVTPQTDTANFLMRVSVDGGTNYLSSNYRYGNYYVASNGTNANSGSTSTSSVVIMSSLGNAAGEGISGKMIFTPSATVSSTKSAHFQFDNSFTNSTPLFCRNFGGGVNTTSSTINAIRFLMSSGNIATGIFKLYGVVT